MYSLDRLKLITIRWHLEAAILYTGAIRIIIDLMMVMARIKIGVTDSGWGSYILFKKSISGGSFQKNGFRPECRFIRYWNLLN